jgi:hypothetical protein
MATTKQRSAARRNVKRAQAGAREKRTIANLPKAVRRALGKEGAKVRRGGKSRSDLYEKAKRLDIRGRSKMGKEQLKRALRRGR